MITKFQAIFANEFHLDKPNHPGKCKVYRRNGQTQLWVTRPDNFRIPVKYGMYTYDNITQGEAHLVHTAEDCPHK